MRRADHPGTGIGEQDGCAVGGENAEHHTGNVSEDRVRLHSLLTGPHVACAGAVHLTHPHHLGGLDTARSRDDLAVTHDRGGIVADGKPEVQRVVGRLADPAPPACDGDTHTWDEFGASGGAYRRIWPAT